MKKFYLLIAFLLLCFYFYPLTDQCTEMLKELKGSYHTESGSFTLHISEKNNVYTINIDGNENIGAFIGGEVKECKADNNKLYVKVVDNEGYGVVPEANLVLYKDGKALVVENNNKVLDKFFLIKNNKKINDGVFL